MKKLIFLIFLTVNSVAMTLWIALSPVEAVPIHYGASGEADRFSSKWELMLMPCVIIAFSLIYAVFCVALRNNRRYRKNEKYVSLSVGAIGIFLLAVFWYLFISCIMQKFSLGGFFWAVISLLMGALMVFLGNFFPKIKQNSFLGIKTYATLHSENVWRKTHRLGGYTTVIGGVIIIIIGIVEAFFSQASPAALMISLGITIVAGCIIPSIYASVLYSKEKKQKVNLE